MRFFHFSSSSSAWLIPTVRWLLAIVAGLVPILFLTSTSEIFEIHKVAVFMVLGGLASLLWMIRWLMFPDTHVRWSRLHTAILFWVVVTGLSTVFSVSTQRSMFGTEGLTGGAWPVILMFALCTFVATQVYTSWRDIRTLVSAIMGGLTVGAVVTIMHAWGMFLLPWEVTHVVSFSPFALSTAVPAIIFASLVVIGMTVWCSTQHWGWRGAGILSVCIGFVGLLTFDLTVGWLALVIALFGSVVAFAFRGKKLTSWWVLIPTGLLAVTVLFMIVPTPLYRAEIPVDTMLDHQTGWDTLITTWSHRPLLGTGPQTFVDAFQQYRPTDFNTTPLWQYRFIKSSTMWFDMGTTTGILGIVALGMLVVFTAMRLLKCIATASSKNEEWFAALGVGGVYILLLCSAFLMPWSTTLWALFWICTTLVIVLVPSTPDTWLLRGTSALPQSVRRPMAIVFVVAIVVWVLLSLGITVKNLRAQQLRAEAAKLMADSGQLDRTQTLLRTAADWDPASVEIRIALAHMLASSALSSLDPTTGAPTATTASYVTAAREQVDTAIQLDPTSALVYDAAAAVLQRLTSVVDGGYAQIITLYEQAVIHDPVHPLLATNLGQARILLAQSSTADEQTALLASAREALARARELKVDLVDPVLLDALALEAGGSLSDAATTYTGLMDTYPADVQIVLAYANFLERTDTAEKALEQYIRATELAPEMPLAHWQLGLAYEKREHWQLALDAFQRVGELQDNVQGLDAKIQSLREKLGE